MGTKKVLIFAGTTEGRELAEFLDRQGVCAVVSTATEYGGSILDKEFLSHIQVRTGRLSSEEMRALMENENISITVDATHPYAGIVSENVRKACNACGCRYIRLERASEGISEDCIRVSSVEEAVQYLQKTEGMILAATGSKELEAYTKLPDFQTRVAARVLSAPESMKKAMDLGFSGKNLICMQGPFSREMNEAVLRQIHASYMVTKESGREGGFPEKYEAAHNAGVKLIVVDRPEECAQGHVGACAERHTGESVQEYAGVCVEKHTVEYAQDAPEESGEDGYPGADGRSFSDMFGVRRFLSEAVPFTVHRKITLAGIGMGSLSGMTEDVQEAVKEADVLIGAERMLKTAVQLKQGGSRRYFCEYRADKIVSFVREHPEYEKIVILLSGDTGFYSGARKLMHAFEGEGTKYAAPEAAVSHTPENGFRTETKYAASEAAISQTPESAFREEVRVLPGISSVSALCAALNTSWEDAVLVSLHGCSGNAIGAVRANRKVFVLTGGKASFAELCRDLIRFGLGHVMIEAGCSLSYDKEKILRGRPEAFLTGNEDSGEMLSDIDELAAILITNPSPDKTVSAGMADETFFRILGGYSTDETAKTSQGPGNENADPSPVSGDENVTSGLETTDKNGKPGLKTGERTVPMTKREIRTLILSYLQLEKDSIIYDIGAGTGSVSIECALQASDGYVYAIEQREDAAELIRKNQYMHAVSNLNVVCGKAPEALDTLPAPDRAFVGGTAGNLREILETLLAKNPSVRVVISAVTLETLAEALDCMKTMAFQEPEILSVTAAKAKAAGSYHMMSGQNPVYLIAAAGRENTWGRSFCVP